MAVCAMLLLCLEHALRFVDLFRSCSDNTRTVTLLRIIRGYAVEAYGWHFHHQKATFGLLFEKDATSGTVNPKFLGLHLHHK